MEKKTQALNLWPFYWHSIDFFEALHLKKVFYEDNSIPNTEIPTYCAKKAHVQNSQKVLVNMCSKSIAWSSKKFNSLTWKYGVKLKRFESLCWKLCILDKNGKQSLQMLGLGCRQWTILNGVETMFKNYCTVGRVEKNKNEICLNTKCFLFVLGKLSKTF